MAEFLIAKLKQLQEALATLKEALIETEKTKILRDATIQRFEYTLEAFWKLMKSYLAEYEGIEVYSPKGVFREAGNSGLITEKQVMLCFQMIDDRNETTHLYSEVKVEQIYSRIKNYADFMDMAYQKLSQSINQ